MEEKIVDTAKQKPTRKKGLKKAVVITAVALLLCVAIVVGIAGGYITDILSQLHRDEEFGKLENEDLGIVEEKIEEDVFNIALFGVDAREQGDFSGNSDSIMILSVQQKENKIKIVSIMRDSLVPIEAEDGTIYKKINTAYHNGGCELAVKTLNQVFGLDIKDYATVNFYGMGDIIEAVDGITANITQAEINDNVYGINALVREQCEHLGISPDPYIITEPGSQHLNGVQAVAYARIRYVRTADGISNDFGRVERQRYVMQQLLTKALSLDTKSYPKLIKSLFPHVKTSLSTGELLGLAKCLSSKPELFQTRVPSDEYIINSDYRGTGASTVYYNYEYAAKIVHAFLYENISPEYYMSEYGIDKTPWYGV